MYCLSKGLAMNAASKTLIFPFFLWFLFFLCQASKASPPSLTEICQKHQNSLELINQIHCKFKSVVIDNNGNGKTVSEGEYWKRGRNYCLIENMNSSSRKLWFEDAKYWILNTEKFPNGKPRKYGQIQAGSGEVNDSVRLKALGAFSGPNGAILPFYEIAKNSNFLKEIKNTSEGLIYINLFYDGISREFYIDPKANYLVRKMITIQNNPKSVFEVEVTSFFESANGIFFPSNIETRSDSKENNNLTPKGYIKFFDITINEITRDSIFPHQFPEGIEVYNSIDNKVYRSVTGGHLIPTSDKLSIASPVENSFKEKFDIEKESFNYSGLLIFLFSLLAFIGGLVFWIKTGYSKIRTS